MEFIKFVFSSFWTFAGFFFLSLIAYVVIKAVFDFIVELIHGKQVIINNPEKIIATESKPKKEEEPTEKVDASVAVSAADVSVVEKK